MPLVAGYRLDSYEIIAPWVRVVWERSIAPAIPCSNATWPSRYSPADWSRDPDRLRRFELEAQAAAALNHPNIISIFHVGQYDGSPYIVIELLQGETLRDHLRRGPTRG